MPVSNSPFPSLPSSTSHANFSRHDVNLSQYTSLNQTSTRVVLLLRYSGDRRPGEREEMGPCISLLVPYIVRHCHLCSLLISRGWKRVSFCPRHDSNHLFNQQVRVAPK